MSAAHEVVFKVTGAHSSFASSFEVLVPPGFDVGAHRHQHSEELFYVAVADRVFVLSNATYSVITPEGCASILWHDPAEAPRAAAALRGDPASLLRLGVVDGVICEPISGAGQNHVLTAERLSATVDAALRELEAMERGYTTSAAQPPGRPGALTDRRRDQGRPIRIASPYPGHPLRARGPSPRYYPIRSFSSARRCPPADVETARHAINRPRTTSGAITSVDDRNAVSSARDATVRAGVHVPR